MTWRAIISVILHRTGVSGWFRAALRLRHLAPSHALWRSLHGSGLQVPGFLQRSHGHGPGVFRWHAAGFYAADGFVEKAGQSILPCFECVELDGDFAELAEHQDTHKGHLATCLEYDCGVAIEHPAGNDARRPWRPWAAQTQRRCG